MRAACLRHIASVLSAALLTLPCAAQSRVGISVGVTRLAFGHAWGGAFTAVAAEARVSRPLSQRVRGDLIGLVITPGGAAAAIADCVVGAPCVDRQTPSLFWGVLPSISAGLGSGGWRVSGGVGGLGTSGMKGPESQSSLAGSIGMHWERPGSGLTPTIGVRALGLASRIAGIRYIVIPAVGLNF